MTKRTLLSAFIFTFSQFAAISAQALQDPPGAVGQAIVPDSSLVLKSRALVSRLTLKDPIRVILRIEDSLPKGAYKDYFTSEMDLWFSLSVEITDPNGRKVNLKVQMLPGEFGGTQFNYPLNCIMSIGAENLVLQDMQGHQYSPTIPGWKENPRAGFFDTEGKYTFNISGTFNLKSQPKTEAEKWSVAKSLPFKSAEITIERLKESATLLSLADLEKKAKSELVERLKKSGDSVENFDWRYVDVDDQQGHRLIRFCSYEKRWRYRLYEVQMAPHGEIEQIASTDISTCVAKGTLIETLSGGKPVEQVIVGEQVWAYDLDRKQRVPATVEFIRRSTATETLVFGGTLRVTGDHPLCASGKWKLAEVVQADDDLIDSKLQLQKAGPVKPMREAIAVYDLSLSEPHNFFASGFLVHNKSRAYWPKTDDPWYALWPEMKTKLEK
jgi:hypothetical protein